MAVLLTAVGALVSIMSGRPDAALLVVPWAVLLVLGLSGTRPVRVSGSVKPDVDRVVSGGVISVTANIVGAAGWVVGTCQPAAGFRDDDRSEHSERQAPGDASEKSREEVPDKAAEEVTEKAPEDPSDEVLSVADVAIPDRQTDLVFRLKASAWGSHDVGRIALQINEPYGLLRWSGFLHVPSEVRVHPHPVDLRRLLTPWYVRRLTGAHRSRSIGRGVEYADVRPFGSGDSLRDINWRASARSDELWVSQRHPERSTDVVLLLDTFVESGHDVRAALGLAVEAAIALAESHLSASDRVGLIQLGGIVRWVIPGAGRHQLQRLADALLTTRLYENAAERDVRIVPTRALPPRSFIVALSPLLDHRFVESLGVLRAAGHDVSVIECPPLLEPIDEDELSATARLAHRLWHLERTMTRDGLAERGIAVGRWLPGDHLEPVLADLAARRNGARIGGRR